jgi:hypothetical protein
MIDRPDDHDPAKARYFLLNEEEHGRTAEWPVDGTYFSQKCKNPK